MHCVNGHVYSTVSVALSVSVVTANYFIYFVRELRDLGVCAVLHCCYVIMFVHVRPLAEDLTLIL